ncbi:MAG: hypothetical protein EOP36_18320, partial [Rubrivivax sp.]
RSTMTGSGHSFFKRLALATAFSGLTACGGGSSDPPPSRAPETADQIATPLAAPPGSTQAQWPPAFQTLPSSACSPPLVGSHATYHVGPGRQYTELTDVPWLSLQAGDVVNIYHRAAPYKTKFGLRAQGTANAPVYINGVTDAQCNRPVISGDGAVTATDAARLNFGEDIQNNGLIQIYRLSTDDRNTYTPRYITIQNLKVMNAQRGKSFKGNAGDNRLYDDTASGIYAIRVAHLTVENCEITENGNGVFTNTRGLGAADFSAYVIIRRNQIYLNGNANRSTEHGLYIQAYRTLYEGNFIGQDRGGSSLKDRSSGTVVRYNKILASARALDLVETEEEYVQILQLDPLYHHAWVYGNVLVNDFNAPLGNSARPIHWGHDNNGSRARTGTLFFYGNTYVNKSKSSQYYYTTVFQIGGNDDDVVSPNTRVEASGNIFWNDDGSTQWFFLANRSNGKVHFRGTNHVPTAWDATEKNSSRVTVAGNHLVGDQPGLATATYWPLAGSSVLNKGIAGPSFTPAGATAANLVVQGVFTEPMGIARRPTLGGALDLGAMEAH